MTAAAPNGAHGTGGRLAVAGAVRAAAAEASIDAIAARDVDTPDEIAAATWPPGPGLLSEAFVEIEEQARRPWVSLRIGDGEGDEIESLPTGAVAFLLGAPGAGKSSIAVELAIHHARSVGPVVFLSREMKRTFVAARFASNVTGMSWRGVLRAEVDASAVRSALAGFSSVAILDRGDAIIPTATKWITGWRARGDDRPILVIADYVQILDGHDDAREERARIGRIVEELREWTDRQDVITLALSQMGRTAAKALLAGETVGASAAAGGAESSQIERAAFVVLAIGEVAMRDDGYMVASLSVAKSRLGQGDRVIPIRAHMPSGRYRVTGPAVSGAERAATREATKNARAVEVAGLAIMKRLEMSAEPMSRSQAVDGVNRATGLAAVRDLIADGRVVSVVRGKKGKGWPIWTPERAAAAGYQVAPEDGEL